MSSVCNNMVLLAAAGSRKTEHIIDSALAITSGRVLITTYTSENQRHITRRIENKVGAIPPNITIMGWFAFLISQCAKPYQRAIIGEPLKIRGLNFKGRRNRFTKKSELRYFLDSSDYMYRDGISDFVVALNHHTNGAIVERLERIFSHIFVDEVQDLVGYDLDVLELLLGSCIKIVLVGDPRQHTLATNTGSRNKKYRGRRLVNWFSERSDVCVIENRCCSYRCNQAICDFADSIYPDLPRTESIEVRETGHDGIFFIPATEAVEYFKKYYPVTVLRHNKNVDTQGLPAMNIGVAKGSTFDRVLLFPTKPILQYLKDGDETKLKTPERLYVAVTRAKFSVAIVVPD